MRNPVPVTVEDKAYHVHPMTAGQLCRWHAYLTSPGSDKITADFLAFVYSVKDAEGVPVWKTAEDAEGMSVATRLALRPVVASVNGFDQDDDEKKAN